MHEQAQQQEQMTRVEYPGGVADCLEQLMGPSGASLLLSRVGAAPQPVVLVSAQAGEPLCLDLSAARSLQGPLSAGGSFCLLGQSGGKILRSCPLQALDCGQANGRLQARCPYPDYFEVIQRRDTFRAELSAGMNARVLLGSPRGQRAVGYLRDLSLGGCNVELPLSAARLLFQPGAVLTLKIVFPSGASVEIDGELRREMIDVEQRLISAGFRFDEPGAERERQLWSLVRDIEREATRRRMSGGGDARPTPLFQPRPGGDIAGEDRVKGLSPVARLLLPLADFIETQILLLRRGGDIDGEQLSVQAERLLSLLAEDRQSLLLETAAPGHFPPLIDHCLAVATRLVDISDRQALPQPTRKALAATALIHDLGKMLVGNDELPLDTLPHSEPGHVQALLDRLGDCRWLSSSVVEAVVGQAHERLDGSGYPLGLGGNELRDLGRLMAVVDTVDLMGRARPQGEPWAIDAIYFYLLSHGKAFDLRCVKLYRQHFGPLPVGTLVRYDNGSLGRIVGVGANGQPDRVLVAEALTPEALARGQVVEGRGLAHLGRVKKVMPPHKSAMKAG